MAKGRVDLKGVNRAVDRLAKDLKKLQGKAASRGARAEMSALNRKLTRIKTLMADECPKVMFRDFDVVAPGAARRAKRAKAARPRARKKAR